eukprot:12842986-Prorocentrum_lima.AAC.1
MASPYLLPWSSGWHGCGAGVRSAGSERGQACGSPVLGLGCCSPAGAGAGAGAGPGPGPGP